MSLPPKYLANLSPSQRVLQAKLIKQSQKEYKDTGKVQARPRVSAAKTPRSSHVKKFESKYGFKITDKKKVKDLFTDTDVDSILAKGLAAYASSGSRPNTTPHAWAAARLASVLTGGNAYKIDKNLVGPKSRGIIF